MTLDLKAVFAAEGASLPIGQELDMSSVGYAGGFPLKKAVSAVGSVFNKAGVVSLSLKIVYEFSAPCDRCGVETAREHTITLDTALAVSIEGEDSDTILTVPQMKLDVDELVFSEVVFDLPTKHLCAESCKGICPKCGKCLNEGACGCPEREVDPRLSPLAELLDS